MKQALREFGWTLIAALLLVVLGLAFHKPAAFLVASILAGVFTTAALRNRK